MELLQKYGASKAMEHVDFVKGKIIAGDPVDLDILSERTKIHSINFMSIFI